MKKVLQTMCIIIVCTSYSLLAQDPFITTWKTDNPGTSDDNQITIPTTGSGYDYTVEWGDGSSDNNITGDITHTYGDAGTYTVTIIGDFPRIYFNNAGDRQKILTIQQWGDIAWTSMANAFYGCSNLRISAIDAPDLSNVTVLTQMFRSAVELNDPIDHWDVSTVEIMSAMFMNANKFNQALDNWNVSQVSDMSNMFRAASDFNQDLNSWNVANVMSMSGLFFGANDFNGDISDWDVKMVNNMTSLFNQANSFNGSIGDWDVSSVTTMSSMFSQANSFNQNLGSWDVSNVGNMQNMFVSTAMSKANYDNLLIGWSALTLQNAVDFRMTTQYCNGAAARSILTGTYSWNITDNGQSCVAFITSWETTAPNESITMPTFGSGYDYDVDWGDGTAEEGFTGDASHIYATAGTYSVAITGDFPRVYFNNGGDKDKILNIDQWGDIRWESMASAFRGCSNLSSTAMDNPNLTNVTSLESMFREASSFNGDLSGWDTGNITTMHSMFRGASVFNQNVGGWDLSSAQDISYMFSEALDFNQDIGSWDVSNVSNMRNMFFSAMDFNQNINSWDVSKVTTMIAMFNSARTFNQPLDTWDVSKVEAMNGMFTGAFDFNQDIGSWNVGMVEAMGSMFDNAQSFNQDIGSWDVSSVTSMVNMFNRAQSFDRDLSGWNVSSVTSMSQMFNQSDLSTANYDRILNGWSQLTLQNNVAFGASGTDYCNGAAGHDILEMTYNWTISDAGLNCQSFITTWQTSAPNESITIPTTASGYDYDVDWGDGSMETGFTGDASHMYVNAGTYTVSITGDFPRIYFNNSGDKDKIQTVEQWGDIQWISMIDAFKGCSNLRVPATDAPDLSDVSSTLRMFMNATAFNDEINHWDVSTITNISDMFHGTSFNQDLNNWDVSNVTAMLQTFASTPFNGDVTNWDVSNVTEMVALFVNTVNFNQDISQWDVSKVDNMVAMFKNTNAFNQDIGDWDVSNVTDMSQMFFNAAAFNQNIDSWNVSNVTNMSIMFRGADSFNQPLNSWDVSGVTSMVDMFRETNTFNQDLSNWITASVEDMSAMFFSAHVFNGDISTWNVSKVLSTASMLTNVSSFNQDLSGWDVSMVNNMADMFNNSGLSTANYDNILNGWSQLTLQSNVNFGVEGIKYCNGASGRETLEMTYNWTIIDEGPCNTETDIVAFTLAGSIGISVNANNHTVDVTTESDTELNNQTPDIVVSEGASISPTGAQDFSGPVVYTVTAEDGVTTQEWTVTVTQFPFDQIGADIDGEAAEDRSGSSVSLNSDGTIVAIGATGNSENDDEAGHVRVFQNQSGSWTQIGLDIDGEAAGDNFGGSVDLNDDGSIVAIGATENSGSASFAGHVRVFKNMSGIWTQIGQDIEGEAADDRSGESVSLSADGTVVAIGSDQNNASTGHVRVYENLSGTWTQIGMDIDGEATNDNFGRSVSLSADGTMVAIGAPFNDGSGDNAGQVKIFENQSGTWTQIGASIGGEAAGDRSGISVSLSDDGNIVAIGAERNADAASNAGHVRVYQNQSDTWIQLGQDIDGEANGDNFGGSVSLSSDGMTVAVGATDNDGNGDLAGHVRIFRYHSGNWTQVGTDIDGEAALDASGNSVSMSADGSVVAIGAERNGGAGDKAGHVRIFDLPSAGTDIISLELLQQTGEAMIDVINHTVMIEVEKGTNIDNLTPTIVVSEGASITPTDAQNFNDIVNYTVTAEDGIISQDWEVTVTVAPNTPPIVSNALGDLTLEEGFGSSIVNVLETFSDADGDALTMTASSSNSGVVTVSVSGSTLTITEVGIGSAVITVDANDGFGGEVSDDFSITVSEASADITITGNIDDLDFEDGFGSGTVALDEVFADLTGATITVESTDQSVVTVTISGTNVVVTEVGPGTATVTVTVTDDNGNSATIEFDVTVDDTGMVTGIDDEITQQVSIYPNPSTDYLNFRLPMGHTWSLTIYDQRGKLYWQTVEIQSSSSINVSNWRSGLYYLKLSNDTQFTTTKVLIGIMR